MNNYHIQLEIISPTHIGSGGENDWAQGTDFVCKNGNCYVLDLHKAQQAGVEIPRLTACFLNNDEKAILQILGKKLEQASRYIFPTPTSSTNPTKAALRNQMTDLPIIAGSSLKGAICSALHSQYTREDQPQQLLKHGTILGRFIKVSDFEMEQTQLVNTKIFNLRKEQGEWEGGWKHSGHETSNQFRKQGFNTLYECLVPGTQGVGHITIEPELFRQATKASAYLTPKVSEKDILLASGVTTLFAEVNRKTRAYLQKEHAFFSAFGQAERTEEITNHILSLMNQIPANNKGCLIKMSAGSGFHSITGDYLYENYIDAPGFHTQGRHAGKKKYKSRKIADTSKGLCLMGFVKLTLISPEEYKQAMAELDQKHHDIFAPCLEAIHKKELKKKIQAETQKKEEEEKQKQIAEKQRLEAEYQNLLQQAKLAADAEDYVTAMNYVQQAQSLHPNGTMHNELITEYLPKKRAQEETRQKAAQEDRYTKPLAEVLNYSDYTSQELKKWLKVPSNHFEEKDFNALLAHLQHMDAVQLKKAIKKKQELVQLIGNSFAQKIISELNL